MRPSRIIVALPVLACLLLAAAPCCDCRQDPSSKPERGQQGSDGGQAAHPLAGSWSGSASVPGQGMVTGVVSIDDLGHGLAVIAVRGVTLSEAFRIEQWSGGMLRASHAGNSYTLRAELDGPVLHVDLPWVGWVRLVRRQR